MKKFFYGIYTVLFNIFRLLPVKPNKISFLSPHNENFAANLGAVMDEVIMRDEFLVVKIECSDLKLDKSSFGTLLVSIKKAIAFFTVKAYHLATSHFVFMNDNFMPMAKLRFSSKTVITQLWHAEGVFKKFGLNIDQPDDVRRLEKQGNKKLSYVVCSSEQVAPIYAEAFGVAPYKVLPLGSPRADLFFKPFNETRARAELDKRYPEIKNKKLVLYAPTFRDEPNDDRRLLNSIDAEAFNERFGDDCRLLVRLHPQVHTSAADLSGATDVGDFEDVSLLVRLCDVLITDYSSICMDFALLEKPIYFYAFDLEKYSADRSFYYDYETYVPGPVAKDFQTLLNLMNSQISQTYKKRMYDFRFFNFGAPDGEASKRIVDRIVYGKTTA